MKSRLHYATHAACGPRWTPTAAQPRPSPRSDPHDDRLGFRSIRPGVARGRTGTAGRSRPRRDARGGASHHPTASSVLREVQRVLHIAAADCRGRHRPAGRGRSRRARRAAIAGTGDRPTVAGRLGSGAVGAARSRAREPLQAPPCSPTRTPTSSRWTRATRAPAAAHRPAGSRSPARVTRTADKLSIAVDGSLRDPAWSPDGTQIAFVAATPTGATLWTAGADGSKPTKVASCASPCSFIDRPAWSPDGTQLVFTETDVAAGKAQPTAGADRPPHAGRRLPVRHR